MRRQRMQTMRRHIFKFSCYGTATLSQLIEPGQVIIVSLDMRIGNRSRWPVRRRVEHHHAIAERLRGMGKHPAKLTAAKQTKPFTWCDHSGTRIARAASV